MWVSLFSLELDDDDLIKRIKDKKDDFYVGALLDITEKITYDIIYSMFFEDPKEYLFCVIIANLDKKEEIDEVIYTVTLDQMFYDKHIGKLIKEAQHRVTNDIIIKFITKMEEIDWRTV